MMAQQAADAGDEGTNDLSVRDVIRMNEMQVWFLAEHPGEESLVYASGRD
jgi:starvation-inducible DNA-binding protein